MILSGLYPQKKFLLYSKLDSCSRIGTQTCSVHPGYTVDSYITTLFLYKYRPTNFEADFIASRLGFLFLLIGVGTVIIYMFEEAISSLSEVKDNLLFFNKSFDEISRVRSNPPLNS